MIGRYVNDVFVGDQSVEAKVIHALREGIDSTMNVGTMSHENATRVCEGSVSFSDDIWRIDVRNAPDFYASPSG